MKQYLENKPQHKAGEHEYAVAPHQLKDRALFASYQHAYNVPDEV